MLYGFKSRSPHKSHETPRVADSTEIKSMPDHLPKYDKPPVVETALSAQFSRLPKFRTAHAGCFWKTSLDSTWKTIEETIRIDDNFERFGDERPWGPLGGGFRLATHPEPQRTQIIRGDGARMIQIQDSRFIYNWKKSGDSGYPSYQTTRDEFSKKYASCRQFFNDFGLGTVEENQWEIVYVNHIEKGDLWDAPRDWPKVFPRIAFPAPTHSSYEGMLLEWFSVIGENIGRLRTHLAFGRIAQDGPEALILTLTARGPAGEKIGRTVEMGFEIGHECIVNSFTEMTSPLAHEHWQRSA